MWIWMVGRGPRQVSRSLTRARKTQRNGKLRLRGACAQSFVYSTTDLACFAVQKWLWIVEMRWMCQVGKSAIRASYYTLIVFLIALTMLCHRVPYAALANAFALIEATTKRIEKTSLLTSLMLLVIQRSTEGDTDSLLRTVYLCINRVRFSSDERICSSG